MKLRPLCVTLTALGLALAASAQPTEAHLEGVATLVQLGRIAEAQTSVETLLVIYPGDPSLIEIQRLLRARLSTSKEGKSAPPPPRLAPQLTGLDSVVYDSIQRLISQVPDADPARYTATLQRVLDDSATLIGKYPDLVPLWSARATAALALDDEHAGLLAAERLLKLGAADSPDPALRDLLASLHLKGWLTPGKLEAFLADEKERERKDAEAGALLADKTATEHWIAACESISRDYRDEPANHDFRVALAQLAYAHGGRFDDTLARLDALRGAEKLSDLHYGYFLRETGNLMVKAGRLDDAMALLPRIAHSWHARELARHIAENCVSRNRPDLAGPALQSAYESQEHYVNSTGGTVIDPVNRCDHFTDLAISAFEAGLPVEAAGYIRRSEEFVPRFLPPNACWGWMAVGTAYAYIGDLANAERALTRMTTGDNTIAAVAYNGWKTAVAHRVNANDPAGARRLLDGGRTALNKAVRHYKFITRADVAENLSEARLQKDPFTASIEAKRPDDALNHYTSKAWNLRFNAAQFHSVFDLFLDAGRLDDARRMQTAPKLGLYSPPNNQDDVKETADTLAFARGKLAAALLTRQGLAAQETYVASLGANLDPKTRFQIALRSAYGVAEQKKTP